MRRFIDLLTRPMVAGLVAAVTTALLIPPTVIHQTDIIERVVVRDPVTPQVIHEVVYRTQKVCDGESVIRALNEVLRSMARTGEATVDADARSRAKGDAAASVAQSGVATSGPAIIGQAISAISLCGSITIEAHNTVTDSVAITGDAMVENEADVEAAANVTVPTSPPSPTPSPSQGPPPLTDNEQPSDDPGNDDGVEDGIDD